MQLIQVGITHQVAKQVPTPRPDRRVHQECHDVKRRGVGELPDPVSAPRESRPARLRPWAMRELK
jgi:hypothetical protein